MDAKSTQRAHMPEGTNTIIGRRTLSSSNKRLAELLGPGMSVLDVGCGSGAITVGMAESVGPEGLAVGMDVNVGLIEEARSANRDRANLSFELGDIYRLPYENRFDIVTASRVLQWLAEPEQALRSLIAALKPGGTLLILDYNHEKLHWEPEAPVSMQQFYKEFLAWRADAGMNNEIADELADMMEACGLVDIRVSDQSEAVRSAEPEFEKAAGIWADVAASRGHQLVAEGWLTVAQRQEAEREYRQWVQSEGILHQMYLLAVEGRKPVSG